MKYLSYPFILLWRIWFYILMFTSIVFLFPLLIISILKERWYVFFFRLSRVWAKIMLYGMGFFPKILEGEKIEKGKSYLLVSNHTSMIDIMMMLYISKNPFVFVGKKELGNYPLFGFFYKRTCILVDRNDSKSRQGVFLEAKKRLDQGLSVCIFPEGGVPDDRSLVLDTFRDGAFRLAINHQIPVVPIVFYNNKEKFSYKFFSGKLGVLRAKILEFKPTKGLELKDKRALNNEVRGVILEALTKNKS